MNAGGYKCHHPQRFQRMRSITRTHRVNNLNTPIVCDICGAEKYDEDTNWIGGYVRKWRPWRGMFIVNKKTNKTGSIGVYSYTSQHLPQLLNVFSSLLVILMPQLIYLAFAVLGEFTGRKLFHDFFEISICSFVQLSTGIFHHFLG